MYTSNNVCYNVNIQVKHIVNYMLILPQPKNPINVEQFFILAADSNFVATALQQARELNPDIWESKTTTDFVNWRFGCLLYKNFYTAVAFIETTETDSIDLGDRNYLIATLWKYRSNLEIYQLSLGTLSIPSFSKDFVDTAALRQEWYNLVYNTPAKFPTTPDWRFK